MVRQLREKNGLSVYHRPETIEFHRAAVGKVLQLMGREPGAILDWDLLAETACMSRYHFLRVFEELTQASPHRFLIALRIEKAKRLLLETTMDVNDICLKVGYASAGTFIRIFKELVGMSPGSFRQLAEKLNQHCLQLLLARLLDRENHRPAGNNVRASLRVTEPFAGSMFVGLFNSQFQMVTPSAGVLLRQSRLACLPLPPTNEGKFLLAVAFADPMKIEEYFLPGPNSPIAISSLSAGGFTGVSDTPTAILNLQPPSLFNFPILICVPRLLVKLAEVSVPE